MMNTSPNLDWSLADWLNALAIRDSEFAELLVREGVKPDKLAASKYIYDVKSPKRRQRIAHLSDAYAVIRCLNFIAEEKNLPYMACINLKVHGELLLNNSNICSREFGEFSEREFSKICKHTKREFNAFGVISKVHPSPPLYLAGRDQDLIRVIESVHHSPITVISGLAGTGKTALAWHTIKRLMQRNNHFLAFDWTTDKRYVVGIDGFPRKTGVQELNFDAFLKSMIARFAWDDLIGEVSEHLLVKCGTRLSEHPYLLVIDNLETVKDSEFMVERLMDLLGRGLGKIPISRAIITSRHRVEQAGCRSIALHGIDAEFRVPYLKELLDSYDLPQIPLWYLEGLADISDGNPLLMQIGLQRYALNTQVVRSQFEELAQYSGFLTIFQAFFDPILQDLKTTNRKAYWLLLCAAHLTTITTEELLMYWQHQFGTDHDESYYEVLSILRKKMLLEWHGYPSGEYSMHPFIQTYLRTLDFDHE